MTDNTGKFPRVSVGLLLADMSASILAYSRRPLKTPEPRTCFVIVFRYLSREVLWTLTAVTGVLLLIIMITFVTGSFTMQLNIVLNIRVNYDYFGG